MANDGYTRGIGSSGEVLQSAMPKRGGTTAPAASANGLLVRGVVLKAHVYDDLATPLKSSPGVQQNAIYCDVLVYAGLSGNRTFLLTNCLWPGPGLHDGDVQIPRATTMDVTSAAAGVNVNSGTDPANMDGDHVLVGFMDGDVSLPVILCRIPHPRADVGTIAVDVLGHRVRTFKRDAHQRLWRHHGSYWGTSSFGDYVVDTTRANDGTLQPNGEEKAPALDGVCGNQEYLVPKGSTWEAKVLDDPDHPNTSAILGRLIVENGRVTVRAGADSEIQVTSIDDTARVLTGKVELGDGVTDPVVLGQAWTTARAQMNTSVAAAFNASAAAHTAQAALIAAVGAWAAAYAQANPPPKPDGVAAAAIVPLATAAATAESAAAAADSAAAQAVTTFENGATSYLSQDVSTR